MAKRINMISGAAAQGGPGVGLLTSAGNPWTVPDDLANDLVLSRRLATFVDAQPAGLLPMVYDPNSRQAFAGQSPVPGFLVLYNLAPNIELNDLGASGTAANPFTAYLIPGGTMGANSLLEASFDIECTGPNNTKQVHIRIGQAGTTWALATPIGGQTGLDTQKHLPQSVRISCDGVTNRQRSTPVNARDVVGQSGSNPVVTTLDVGLDFYLWVGFQHGLQDGGTKAFLRRSLITVTQ